MDKKEHLKTDLESQALTVIEMQRDLEKQSEEFKAFLQHQKEVSEKIALLKSKLKEEMSKNNIDEIVSPKGEDDWKIKVWQTTRVNVDNIDDVEDDYKELEEINGIIEKDGKYYQEVGKTELVKNLYLNGVSIPKGFSVKQNPSIKITINRKVV